MKREASPKRKRLNLHILETEQTNAASSDLDRKSSLEIARIVSALK